MARAVRREFGGCGSGGGTGIATWTVGAASLTVWDADPAGVGRSNGIPHACARSLSDVNVFAVADGSMPEIHGERGCSRPGCPECGVLAHLKHQQVATLPICLVSDGRRRCFGTISAGASRRQTSRGRASSMKQTGKRLRRRSGIGEAELCAAALELLSTTCCAGIRG